MSPTTSDAEERANAITHGLGFLLSLAASWYLLARLRDQPRLTIAACGVYLATLVLLYGVSTLSHAVRDTAWRKWLRMADQSCIFLLIAGSYTPFGVIYLGHGSWWLLLAGMWSLALAGVFRVAWIGDLPRSDKAAYGMLGLLPILGFGEMAPRVPAGLFYWLIAGGAFYLSGTIFLRFRIIARYSHATWHMFVIAGSACHYTAIVQAVSQSQP